MAIGAPSSLVATPISSTRIDLSWVNGDEYDFVHIERRIKDVPPFVQIDMVDGSQEYYADESPPLTPEEIYEYQIRGRNLYPVEEYSGYSGIAEGTTFATLAPPSLCVAIAFSDFIEITWKDNSSREDDFRLWRKVGAGAWGEYQTIPANMDYYRDTAVTPGTLYTYRVLAKDGAESSAPSNENAATALSLPTAPTVLVKSGVQDKSIQLSWTDNATTETGFRIEIGIDVGFVGVTHRVIGADITKFLVTGLDPSTQYWFRVRAYNGVGNSAYSNVVTDTTLAAGVYVPTEFEKWIRNPNIEPVYLVEIYTKMDLTGFVIHGAGPAWKKTIGASDRGIDILEVFEDGTAYTKQTSIATVEANASSFWFDYDNRILYIHATGGADPAGFLIEGAFWLYFSTHPNIEFTVNGRLNHYLPLLAKEDIPDITQEIKSYFEGGFGIASGSVAFMNGEIGGEHFFDKKYASYTWENSKLVLKAGKDDFTYANFETILTSFVDEKNCNDSKITFSLRDLRQGMERDLVLNKFWMTDQGDGLAFYPDMEEDFDGEPIPICFGAKEDVVPIPIDVANRKYKYHDGRSKSVETVWQNGIELDVDTHYFVDLQRSIITFESVSLELGEEDIITVNFTGSVNSADEPIRNGAEVFKYLMNTHYELLDSKLNLDSIYEAKYAKTDSLSIFLYKDTPYDEIVRNIEHSAEAYTFQDEQGRLGLKPQQATASSRAKYVVSEHIFGHLQSKRRSSLFWKVNVWYNENPQSQDWEVKWAEDVNIPIRYKNWNELNVNSYFKDASSAQTLATNIMALLNKETIEDTLPMLLFDVMAGDIVKFSRTRFYSASGMASEIDLRIISISKSPASGRTTITTELV